MNLREIFWPWGEIKKFKNYLEVKKWLREDEERMRHLEIRYAYYLEFLLGKEAAEKARYEFIASNGKIFKPEEENANL